MSVLRFDKSTGTLSVVETVRVGKNEMFGVVAVPQLNIVVASPLNRTRENFQSTVDPSVVTFKVNADGTVTKQHEFKDGHSWHCEDVWQTRVICDGKGISVLTVDGGGQLAHLSGSPFQGSRGAMFSRSLSSNGRWFAHTFYVFRDGTPHFHVFKVAPDGSMAVTYESFNSGQGRSDSLAFAGDYLAASSEGKINLFKIDDSGSAQFLSSVPHPGRSYRMRFNATNTILLVGQDDNNQGRLMTYSLQGEALRPTGHVLRLGTSHANFSFVGSSEFVALPLQEVDQVQMIRVGPDGGISLVGNRVTVGVSPNTTTAIE